MMIQCRRKDDSIFAIIMSVRLCLIKVFMKKNRD